MKTSVLRLERVCSVEECEEQHIARGMCRRHYTIWYEQEKRQARPAQTKICCEEGCGKPHLARGWCGLHYSRWYERERRDEPNYRKRKKDNSAIYRSRHLERVRVHSRQRTAKWRERHPDYARQTRLKKYGLTHNDYALMFEAQAGVCAVCSSPPHPRYALHIDHDHRTGAVRGLLCDRCNRSLGGFDDDVERLRAAVAYLTKGGDA